MRERSGTLIDFVSFIVDSILKSALFFVRMALIRADAYYSGSDVWLFTKYSTVFRRSSLKPSKSDKVITPPLTREIKSIGTSPLQSSIRTPGFRLSARIRFSNAQNRSDAGLSLCKSSLYSRHRCAIYASCQPPIRSRNSFQSCLLISIRFPPVLFYNTPKRSSSAAPRRIRGLGLSAFASMDSTRLAITTSTKRVVSIPRSVKNSNGSSSSLAPTP